MNNLPDPDQRKRMVDDALHALSAEFKPVDPTDAEILLKRAMEISRAVKAVVKPMEDAQRQSGLPHDTKTLASVISRVFFEGFNSWSKDELLFLVVLMHTEVAVESITGETNTGRIIKPI